MRNLKIHYLLVENFLCFERLEINFANYGNIVSVTGQNKDVCPDAGENASNGTGKSAIIDAIVCGFYGKTLKKPKKINNADVVNHKNGGNMSIELRWDEYRLVRTRKPDTLRLWQSKDGVWDDDTEISVGGIPATQKEIESKLGLNYEAFINIFVFSDDNTIPFLDCEPAGKREIVENYLALDRYRTYAESAKNQLKDLKGSIKSSKADYDRLLDEVEAVKTRLKNIDSQETEWKAKKEREAALLLDKINKKLDSMDKTDDGVALKSYNDAQEQVKDLESHIPVLEEKKKKIEETLKPVKEKMPSLEQKIKEAQAAFTEIDAKRTAALHKITENRKVITTNEGKAGDCPWCYSPVQADKISLVIQKAQDEIEAINLNLEEEEKNFTNSLAELEKLKGMKTKWDNGIVEYTKLINGLDKEISGVHSQIASLSKIKKPEVGVDTLLIESEINELKKQWETKKAEMEGPTPFVSIREATLLERDTKATLAKNKEDAVKELEEDLPYYEFWVEAFGDNGIRKYIIDGIIPVLNGRIEFWLQFLIENKMKLVFNNKLEYKIDRYPFNNRPYLYHLMSGGQRRRLNLTISQAFAYIMALNCGASPSLVFLDEVTMNMDKIGVQCIYRMICELAKEKQVFVIDHNEALLEMLEGCDKIQLQMQDEVTSIIS